MDDQCRLVAHEGLLRYPVRPGSVRKKMTYIWQELQSICETLRTQNTHITNIQQQQQQQQQGRLVQGAVQKLTLPTGVVRTPLTYLAAVMSAPNFSGSSACCLCWATVRSV